MNGIQAGCLITGDSIFSCGKYHKITKTKARFDKGVVEFYSNKDNLEYLVRCCGPNQLVKAVLDIEYNKSFK